MNIYNSSIGLRLLITNTHFDINAMHISQVLLSLQLMEDIDSCSVFSTVLTRFRLVILEDILL